MKSRKVKNIADIYELSPMQQGMLFHALYAPEADPYFTHSVFEIHGALDVRAFKQAWQEVVGRHPALRSFFVWEDRKKPLQLVRRQVSLPWAEFDWLRVADQDRELENFLHLEQKKGISLQAAPLMRFSLILLADNSEFTPTEVRTHSPSLREGIAPVGQKIKFIFSRHHLLLDGWSLRTILAEVSLFYEAATLGKHLNLESPRPYGEYIVWLREQDHGAAENFWRQNLAGFTTPTSLGDRMLYGLWLANLSHREAQLRDEGDPVVALASPALGSSSEHHFELSPPLTLALQEITREHHLTLNTLVQGAWALLLSRYSGEQDVLFGATVSGRPPDLLGVESMVGLFINSLPVRVVVAHEQMLLSWLQRLQEEQVAREQFAFCSLVDIQGWSEVQRGSALFESLLVFENYPTLKPQGVSQQVGGLHLAGFRAVEQTNYALTVTVIPLEEEEGTRLQFRISYDSNRFDDQTIARMGLHLQTLLQGIERGIKGACLGDLLMLTEAERYQLLVEWNDTQADYPTDKCIHQLFEEQVARTPDAIAIVFGDQKLSYRELNAKANQLAHYLIEQGIGPDMLVGICVPRDLSMVVGLLGILKAGGAYVPLDPSYPKERLEFMLQDANVKVMLTTSELLINSLDGVPVEGHLCPYETLTVCLDRPLPINHFDNPNRKHNGVPKGALMPSGPKVPLLYSRNEEIPIEQLAYVLYTSGSTGRPKGVAIEHRSVVAFLSWGMSIFGPEELAGVLASTSISFDLSVFEIFLPLSCGGKVILAQNALSLPTLEDVVLVNTVPSAMKELVRSDGIPKSVRVVNLAGEALKNELVQQIYQNTTVEKVFNLYGPSEDTTYSTYTLTKKGALSEPTIGHPISNSQCYILDAHLQPVPIGVPGELYLGGAGLARGYLNRPQLTAEKFITNPFGPSKLYKTGDLCRYLPDGDIEFMGRIDHQVKIRGFRIELGEIEAVLSQHQAVQDAVVIVREEAQDKQLVAYLVCQHLIENSALQSYLKEKLPAYMIPTAFVRLDALPLTPNGKINRRVLPAPDESSLARSSSFVAPRGEIESILAAIWQDVLNLQQVGVYDNFFELGGHSLLATQVASRLHKTFKVWLPLRILFEKLTIATLADHIETLQTTQDMRLSEGTPSPADYAIQGEL